MTRREYRNAPWMVTLAVLFIFCGPSAWANQLTLALGCPCGPSAWANQGQGELVEVHSPPVVRLSGSPYEIGRAHGQALHQEIRTSLAQVLGYFRRYMKVPVLRSLFAHFWLVSAWNQARPYIPDGTIEELRGLAHGSGVSLRDLVLLHAIPERTYACSNFAAWGKATSGGRLIHMRNLDWNIEAGLQDSAAVFVVHPQGKNGFVSFGWAGFIGVLTGINDKALSIGQVGAETVDRTLRGQPMPFLMRRVLEEADSLEQAIELVKETRRTVGVNYVIADAKQLEARVLETTHSIVKVFEADDLAEHGVAYARPMADAVFRADTAIDPVIRNQQLASKGDPKRPGLELPAGSAYEVRYLGQARGLESHYGRLDVEAAKAIAKDVAPESNVQSVIFAWPEAWVANAQGMVRAAHTPYTRFDVERLLGER